jgi:hypothetical protein
MEEDKQLYVSFEKDYYKSNKTNLLETKAKLILLQKSLQRLKAIRSTKKRLITQLVTMISSSNVVAQRVYGKFPDVSLHRKMKNENKKKKTSGEKVEDFDVDNLDKELIEINRKLKELNE